MSVESPAINEPKEQNSVETLLFPRASRSLFDSTTMPVHSSRTGLDSAKSGAKANILHLAFQRSPRDSHSRRTVSTRHYATFPLLSRLSVPLCLALFQAFSRRLGARLNHLSITVVKGKGASTRCVPPCWTTVVTHRICSAHNYEGAAARWHVHLF